MSLAVQSLMLDTSEDQKMLDHFWNLHSEQLMKMAIEKQVARATVMFQNSLKRSFQEIEPVHRKKLCTNEGNSTGLSREDRKDMTNTAKVDSISSFFSSSSPTSPPPTTSASSLSTNAVEPSSSLEINLIRSSYPSSLHAESHTDKEESIELKVDEASSNTEEEINKADHDKAENDDIQDSSPSDTTVVVIEKDSQEAPTLNRLSPAIEVDSSPAAKSHKTVSSRSNVLHETSAHKPSPTSCAHPGSASSKDNTNLPPDALVLIEVLKKHKSNEKGDADNASSEESSRDSANQENLADKSLPQESNDVETSSDNNSNSDVLTDNGNGGNDLTEDTRDEAQITDNEIQQESQEQPEKEEDAKDDESAGMNESMKLDNAQDEMMRKSIVEVDMIYYRPNKKSIGTILKRWAFSIHLLHYVHKKDITEIEQKNMVFGLSSILDLSQSALTQKEGTQAYLFKEIWATMKKDIMEKFSTPQPSQHQIRFQAQFRAMYGKADIQTFLKEIQSRTAKPPASSELASLWRIMRRWTSLIRQDNLSELTRDKSVGIEIEYFRKVWSPIFQFLFPATENIRLKVGYLDDVYPASSKYNFKLVAQIENKDYTLAIGECAAPSSSNEGDTLLRKGKDALDEMINIMNIPEDKRYMTWLINIQGFSCTISTIELMANGLYVHIPRFTFCLPHKLLEVHSFIRILNSFISMKFELKNSQDTILNYIESNHAQSRALSNRGKKTRWIRDTWHAPKDGDESHIPRYFTTHPPFSNRRNMAEIIKTDF
ncbi:hypothetical protein BD560DRAFT_437410 [Blakeslea trispora]|nr:hypothetical protein BD560DRAFT_437410 [Blakeslea trispora]